MHDSKSKSAHWRIFRPFQWRFLVKAVFLTAAMLGIEYFFLHHLLDVPSSRGSLLAAPGQRILQGFHRKLNSNLIRIGRLDCATANSIGNVDPCSACGMRQQLTELLPNFIRIYKPSVIAVDFFFDSQTYCEEDINKKLVDVITEACTPPKPVNETPPEPPMKMVFAYGSVGNFVQRPLLPPIGQVTSNCRAGYSNPSRDPRQVSFHVGINGGTDPVASFAAQTATLFDRKLAIANSSEPLRYAYLLSPEELRPITLDMGNLADKDRLAKDPANHQHKVWILGSTRDNLFEVPHSLVQALFHPDAIQYQYGHEIHASHIAALIDNMSAEPAGPLVDFLVGLLLWTAVELARTPLIGGGFFVGGLGVVYVFNALLFWSVGYYSDFATLSIAGILIWIGTNALPNLLRMHTGPGHQ